ncbi:MAG: dTDP-4-dehydrorhamnose reductase [Terriglobia bacterium]
MRVLVTGAKGMLGSALLPSLPPEHQAVGVDLTDFDIGEGAAVQKAFLELRPDFVVHLAAYTDVDGCEANPQRAEAINAVGTWNVARACADIGAAMLYVSTDYVFDGRQERAYREDDCPHPVSVYARTKLRGEQHVQSLVTRHFIVRTSWLYGPQGKNFVATILKLAREREELRVVSDQRGSPTYTRHLALKLAQLLWTKAYGIYHVTGTGECSWFEFAQAIVRSGGYERVRVAPIASQDCGRLATRPANSVLENRRLIQIKLGTLPHWTEGLAQYIEEGRRSGEFGMPGPDHLEGSLKSEVTGL